MVTAGLQHGIPSMTGAQLRALRGVAVPKLVVYGRDDPQMSPADAASTAASIGAPRPVAVPGAHPTVVSSPRRVAAEVDTLFRRTKVPPSGRRGPAVR